MNCKVAVLNLKTTHPNPQKAKILEIGFSIFTQGRLVGQFGYIVNPRTKIHPAATNEHGITPSMVLGQPSLRLLWPLIETMLSAADHIVSFSELDAALLKKQLGAKATKVLIPSFGNCCELSFWAPQDTAGVPLSLNTLCKHYGITRPKRQRALPDTVAIFQCFRKLIDSKRWRLHYSASDAKEFGGKPSIQILNPARFCFSFLDSLSVEEALPRPNLHLMQKDTDSLIKDSKAEYIKHSDKEDIGDFIDQSIIPNIALINKNPALATTGSCSGHAGYPFIALVFRDQRTGILYRDKIREMIPEADIVRSDPFRMGWFKQVPRWRVSEEWNVGLSTRKRSAGKGFWSIITSILKHRGS